MARPLRLEFPGAVYHVTARGDRREDIFLDDPDRQRFLELLGREVEQQQWVLYAYCLMGNHYHLLLETPEANLSHGMRRLNGVYTQAFNRRRGWSGHVLQGRYKAILVDRDAYLLELCRYVVLNPVRAGIVSEASRWPWSSYRATAGLASRPNWVAADAVLALFGAERAVARDRYRAFVAGGTSQPAPWANLTGQIFLGTDDFLTRMQTRVASHATANVPRAQRQLLRPSADQILEAIGKEHGLPKSQVLDRSRGMAFKQAVHLLRRRCNLPLREVAAMAGVSVSRVSQIQREVDKVNREENSLEASVAVE
ncbi:transposase [Methylotetracoccus oryzae]|uniref:transposase n=1 Tax=Methylotetracoccus oryzae TaxID=1919059 RepID=UPI001119FC03|nr:transposase [Methylotetracoccus oryzae]